MKVKIFSIIAIIAIAMLSLLIVSCGDAENVQIETQDFLYEDGIYKVTVPNSTSDFNITSKITINKKADYEFSKDKNFSNTFDEDSISLVPGDNYVYLRVEDGDYEEVYTFNVYRKKMVTVSFNANGGTISNTSIVVEEGTIISAPAAEKQGYTLSWDYDFSKPIVSDITVNATWKVNNCTIIANVDGEVSRYPVAFGAVPTGIAVPEKFGYEFTGWKYGEVAFDPNKPYSYSETEIEIVATFKPVEFKIQYAVDKDSVTNNENNLISFTIVTEDGAELNITLNAPLHKSPNYVFVGWYADNELTKSVEKIDIEAVKTLFVDYTLVLYPKWQIKSSVSYDANGGNCDKTTDDFVYGEAYELPVPTRENYSFEGWFNDETKVANKGVWNLTTDVTLKAKWIVRENAIEYVLGYDDAVNNDNNPLSFDVEDGKIELLPPTFDDKHEFVGWYTNPSFTDDSKITHITADMAGQNVTLYAKWDKLVTITLDANGGTCENTQITLKPGDEYSLSKPTKDKYIFVNWYYGETHVAMSGNWLYDTDVTLTAKWNAAEYKINYVLNGGQNHPDNMDVYTVETKLEDLILKDPIREYYKFIGWYTDAACTTPIASIDPTKYDGITVYAKWESVEITVNYDFDGVDGTDSSETLNLGDEYTLMKPSKPGYNFDGWFMGDVQIPDSGRFTDENLVVYNLVAKWSLTKYKVNCELDNGSQNDPLIIEYTILDDDFQLPTDVEKADHYFVGWSYNNGTPSLSVTISKGSSGDRTYKAVWVPHKDSTTGLKYKILDGKIVIDGIERTIDDGIINGVKIPSQVNGLEVVAIESNAFKDFGIEFAKTSYANMSNSYVTFSIPTTVKRIGANAFDECNGIKVQLYDPDNSVAKYKEWDKTVTWEAGKGNKSARDCIWGFRPAIGWTRYSQVTIPDDYE